jgi:succinoglycan biosynthesis transport protein ExoP
MQFNRSLVNVAGGRANPFDAASPSEMLKSVADFLRRQFPIILVLILMGIGLGVTYVLTAPPMFTAEALMAIDTRKLQMFQKEDASGNNSIDSSMVDSEVQILQSENVSIAVIKRFHLTDDPEFIGRGRGPFQALLSSAFKLFGYDNVPKSEYERGRRAAATFADRLTVKRIGLSYVIQIGFESLDPQRAADIANDVARAYVTDQLEAKFQETVQTGEWAQDRLRELREQTSIAERAVVEFKATKNIVSTGGADKRLVDEQRVAELNSQLVIARAQVSESRARLDRIQTVLSTDTPDASVDATVTDTLKNDVITKLRSQYLTLAEREADWAKRYGSSHLAVANVRNQMNETRNSILDELRRIAESYKSDHEIAKQREAETERELARAVTQAQVADRAQVELTVLESNAQSYRTLYQDFLQRYTQSAQQQSFPMTDARVITPAARPLTKSHPKTLLALLVAGSGGMLLGLMLGHFRDLMDRVFRTRDQVERLLALDCLATVPNIKVSKPKSNPSPANEWVDGPPDARIIPRLDELLWHVVDFPLSPYAEAIRSIRMAADLTGPGRLKRIRKPKKVLGITSSSPNEGKSTISASLAQLISHSGKRVILVDCDLRAPRLTRLMAPHAQAGLLEVMSGDLPLGDVIWTDQSKNLSFLPAVATSRIPHTAEILRSQEMRILFDRLCETYDYVIVDLTPLVPIIDVRATAGFVDYYVFVIEWGRTKVDLVERALKEAAGIYSKILGVALNKVDSSELGRYEGYTGYDHEKYYRR